MRRANLQQMKDQLILFKSKLEEFALKHKADIRRDPVFRAQFHTMCANIGVDPLASNKAGFEEAITSIASNSSSSSSSYVAGQHNSSGKVVQLGSPSAVGDQQQHYSNVVPANLSQLHQSMHTGSSGQQRRAVCLSCCRASQLLGAPAAAKLLSRGSASGSCQRWAF